MTFIKIHPLTKVSEKATSSEVRLKVGLIQVNNSFSGQNYLPYSIACLMSYVTQHAQNPSRYSFLPFIYKRIPIDSIVNSMLDADVVGFSTYVWNANISLEVARRLKRVRPNVLIVFGGPQVPDKPEAFLRENPFIDIVVHNEGEKTFLNLLERMPERNWSGLAGVSFLDPKERLFVKAPAGERMRDLSELPSPFTNGVLDSLILANPGEKWIGLWETNRGCPFQCTFCDWGSATAAKVSRFDMERLYSELDWFVANKIEYVFVCDANFGSQKRDIDIAQKVAELREKTGYPQGFSVQSTKNATERAYVTQKILSDAGLNKGVALSMQSLDPVTLENIKRDNISLNTYLELSRRFNQEKVETYSDLILALPGETYESFVYGIEVLIEAGQHNRIQFNNLSILPNAEMGDPDYLAKFKMVTVCSNIINIHGTKEVYEDDVPETQQVVIQTYSMSSQDWRAARAISWMISFLYFDKLFQIPIQLVREIGNIPYRHIFEGFMNVQSNDYPILSEIREFFLREAQSIQDGGVEYVFSQKWLGIYWPADEYAFIQVTESKRFAELNSEVNSLLVRMLGSSPLDEHIEIISEALKINHSLISQPYVDKDIIFKTQFNIIEHWRGICSGVAVPLVRGSYSYLIPRSRYFYDDFQTWCKEIVWWGNKKGAYLYPALANGNPELSAEGGIELAGHY